MEYDSENEKLFRDFVEWQSAAPASGAGPSRAAAGIVAELQLPKLRADRDRAGDRFVTEMKMPIPLFDMSGITDPQTYWFDTMDPMRLFAPDARPLMARMLHLTTQSVDHTLRTLRTVLPELGCVASLGGWVDDVLVGQMHLPLACVALDRCSGARRMPYVRAVFALAQGLQFGFVLTFVVTTSPDAPWTPGPTTDIAPTTPALLEAQRTLLSEYSHTPLDSKTTAPAYDAVVFGAAEKWANPAFATLSLGASKMFPMRSLLVTPVDLMVVHLPSLRMQYPVLAVK